MEVPVLKCYLYFSVNLLASKKPYLLGLLQKVYMGDFNEMNTNRDSKPDVRVL